jgi:hypothetical protein
MEQSPIGDGNLTAVRFPRAAALSTVTVVISETINPTESARSHNPISDQCSTRVRVAVAARDGEQRKEPRRVYRGMNVGAGALPTSWTNYKSRWCRCMHALLCMVRSMRFGFI